MGQADITLTAGARRIGTQTIQLLILVGILLLIMVVATILTPKFLSYVNMVNVLMQVAMIMLTGSAAVLLMIAGNFDLSVGMVFALTGVMHAFLSKNGVPTALSMVVTILIGSAFGLINGAMVTKLKITPVIATLGTMYVAQGLAFIVAWLDGGANVTTGLPRDFQTFGRTMVGSIPLFLIIVVALIIVFGFLFAKTNLRKYAFAIGGNPVAARLSGIRVGAVITALYVLVGTLTGFGGATLASRMGSGSPKVGTGFEFDVIVAIVLGGTSIYGGEGSFLGMIIGALIVGFVGNILNLLNVQFFYQTVLKGLILVGAVLLTRIIRERRG
ncbi:MAG: ABC transporter permease [Spirochaetia bacterium]|jgi:ribose/xylose/arabinose/galactoside ABC-type transport system permease subunit